MSEGFLIGFAVGVVSAWFLYWRVVKLAAKVGFSKESVYTDVFSKSTYAGLKKMREHLDQEIDRRSA